MLRRSLQTPQLVVPIIEANRFESVRVFGELVQLQLQLRLQKLAFHTNEMKCFTKCKPSLGTSKFCQSFDGFN